MLRRVVDKDLRLYSTAVHTQALLIQQGKLMLEIFAPTMRTLLKQVCVHGVCVGRMSTHATCVLPERCLQPRLLC
jgi:hypothetical protein